MYSDNNISNKQNRRVTKAGRPTRIIAMFVLMLAGIRIVVIQTEKESR